MKLNDQPVPLMPLRGPLGESALFCSGRDAPILRPCKFSRDDALAFLSISCIPIPIAWLVSYYVDTNELQRDLLWNMFRLTIYLWICTELISIGTLFVCYRLKGLRALERRGRFAELALSPARPVEIAQFAFNRDLQYFRCIALMLFTGTFFSLTAFLPALVPFIVPVGFLAINQLRSMQHAMWLEVAAFLSSENWLQHLRMVLAGSFAYLSWILPAFCLARAFQATAHIDDQFLATAVLLAFLAAWCWSVQYFFARGWAARIERAIFHRIEF